MATSTKLADIMARAKAAQAQVKTRTAKRQQYQTLHGLPTMAKLERITARILKAHPDMEVDENAISNGSATRRGEASTLMQLHQTQPFSATVTIYRNGTVTAVNVDIRKLLANL